jgi:hypothetical protein
MRIIILFTLITAAAIQSIIIAIFIDIIFIHSHTDNSIFTEIVTPNTLLL